MSWTDLSHWLPSDRNMVVVGVSGKRLSNSRRDILPYSSHRSVVAMYVVESSSRHGFPFFIEPVKNAATLTSRVFASFPSLPLTPLRYRRNMDMPVPSPST